MSIRLRLTLWYTALLGATLIFFSVLVYSALATNLQAQIVQDSRSQAIAIARAIVNHPHLILADEPTGSLDTETSREILGLLHRYNETRGATVIIVTHDPLVETFNVPLLTLQDGKVVSVADQHALSSSVV